MKALVFVNRAGRVSGAEVVMLKLIDVALARGHRVRVVCPYGPLVDRLPAAVDHVPIAELDLGGNTGLKRLVALFDIMRRWFRAAKVIRHSAGTDSLVIANSLMVLPAARLARIPGGVSWLVHDTVCETKQKLVIRAGRAVVRRAVAVSPPTAESVRALGIPAVVSPLGVDILPARIDCETHEPPVVGIMGVLTPWKGHRILLEALSRIPEVRCEIAGGAFHADQAYADELNELAMEPPLTGRVSFLGHVDPLPTIRQWDALISASTSPEAGPIVALEAMSLRVPVIATDHGGSTWILRDGAGVLVPPGDPAALAAAIEQTLNDPAQVSVMVDRALRRVLDDHDAATTFPAMLDAVLGPSE
jgi:glycosyltransferase involved in cell wall biosynthesis